MALSPGIPTSFVPKQPVQSFANRPMREGNNLFLIVSLILAGVVALVAAGVFAYDQYLIHTLASKQAQLAAAQGSVDDNTIEEFIRLRDRLSNGEDLLTNHIQLSQFFDVLGNLTLQNVRFNSLKLVVAGDHTATIDVTGTAKTFNALAAQSNAFATEKRIKRAIFSGITVDSSKLVAFRLTADIDPRLIIAGPAVTSAGAPITPVTTTAGLPQASTTPVMAPAAKPATSTAATTTP